MKNESVVDNASDLNSPFAVCKAIYDIVGPTLGPMGLYKMVVRKSGTPVVSKNSETILDEIDIEHPAYDLIRKERNLDDPNRDEVIDQVTQEARLLLDTLLQQKEGQ